MQSFVRRLDVRFVPVAAAALVSQPVDAQTSVTSPPQGPPYIAASAVGDTRVVPDRAMLNVAVESQGESAAKVGADNAAKQTRVIDAVKAAGVPAAQIRTSGYNVSPEYVHEKGKPRITGYRAHNNVQVEVRDIASVGKVIDAATAAGGSLGTLLELTIEPYGLPQPLMGRVMLTSAVSGMAPSPTPIETGELVVQAVVRVRWQFVPGQR